MKNQSDAASMLAKYKNITMRDFVLAQMASKIDALELILVDRLYPMPESKAAAFQQIDADRISLL